MSAREVFEIRARVTLDQPEALEPATLDRLHERLCAAAHDALQTVTLEESDRGAWLVYVEVE